MNKLVVNGNEIPVERLWEYAVRWVSPSVGSPVPVLYHFGNRVTWPWLIQLNAGYAGERNAEGPCSR